jgi:hypothetical protein
VNGVVLLCLSVWLKSPGVFFCVCVCSAKESGCFFVSVCVCGVCPDLL